MTTTLTGRGDCYEVALNFLVEIPDEEQDRYRLVHGTPLGQGPIEGIRHGHAWVERTEPQRERPADFFTEEEWDLLTESMSVTVIDKSNGRDAEMTWGLYYGIGQIDPGEVRRYTFQEAAWKAVTTQHYGPWDEED